MKPDEIKVLARLVELSVELGERDGIISEQKKRIEYLEQLVNRLTKNPTITIPDVAGKEEK